uniref:Rho GTPase-activating protein gacU-like n=1 Tax=Dermatophagoides pteronyssinus TaxID=6956 RepID=A0A6P6XXL7_DERPT|nr:rho GTPase-activating protein gacU-like [Dermatophagoides pteronyssinus]
MCTKNCCVLIVLLFIIPLIFWNLSSYVNKKFYSCFSTRENLKYSSLKLLLLYHDKTTKTKEYYHLHLILNDTLYIFETEFRICEQTKKKWHDDTRYRIDGTKLSKINQLKLENVFKPNDQLLVYRFRINVTTSISVIRKRMKKYRYLINTNLPPMNCITDAYNSTKETATTTTTTSTESSKKGYLIFYLNDELITKILEQKQKLPKNTYISTTDCPPGSKRRRNRRNVGGRSSSRNRRNSQSLQSGILDLDCIFGDYDYNNDYHDSDNDDHKESSSSSSSSFNENRPRQLILVIDMISISFTKLIEQPQEENLFNRRQTSSKPESIFIQWIIELYTQTSTSIIEISNQDRNHDHDHDNDHDHDHDHDYDHDHDHDHDKDHKVNSTKFCSGHIPFGYVHRSFVHNK